MRSIIVAVVATVAIIGAAQAQDLVAKRVAPEIGTAGYNNIAAEERHHAAYPRQPLSQRGSQEGAAKRVAPEIGAAGYNIAAEERHHAAYPRRR
jgi:opacity protein-like surface antigen